MWEVFSSLLVCHHLLIGGFPSIVPLHQQGTCSTPPPTAIFGGPTYMHNSVQTCQISSRNLIQELEFWPIQNMYKNRIIFSDHLWCLRLILWKQKEFVKHLSKFVLYFDWPNCSPIPLWVHHFGKRTVWSLLYFLNYAFYDI